jgi:hypothetical protein
MQLTVEFALGLRKPVDNLHWAGRSQDFPDGNWFILNSPHKSEHFLPLFSTADVRGGGVHLKLLP